MNVNENQEYVFVNKFDILEQKYKPEIIEVEELAQLSIDLYVQFGHVQELFDYYVGLVQYNNWKQQQVPDGYDGVEFQ